LSFAVAKVGIFFILPNIFEEKFEKYFKYYSILEI